MRLVFMASRVKNWTWAQFFRDGYLGYDIFNLLRNKNKALTGLEIAKGLGKPVQKNIHYQLDMLVKRKLIFRSHQKIKHKQGWPAHLYATSKRLIDDRIEEIQKQIQEQPYNFNQSDTLKQKICKFLKENEMGYTPLEILNRLGFEEPDAQLKRCV